MFTALLLALPCQAGGPPPVITVQPQSTSAPLLGIVTFSVTASSGTTMSYQWYKDGSPIAGATSRTYTVLTVLGTSAGNYYVKITNAGGYVISDNATLNVLAPPAIITQPQSQSTPEGQLATFTIVASGTGPLTYQWYHNGASVGSEGNSATLTLTNAQPQDAGNYRALVSNSFGAVTSTVAALIVFVPPSITAQPQSLTATQGDTAAFSVTATGSGQLSYQWSLNGAALPGATASTLTLPNVQLDQVGTYSVVVTNPLGVAASSPAELAVLPVSVSVAGGNASSTGFSFQISVSPGHTYVVLATTDFQSWTPIATNTTSTGTVTFTDPNASAYPARFYRAVTR